VQETSNGVFQAADVYFNTEEQLLGNQPKKEAAGEQARAEEQSAENQGSVNEKQQLVNQSSLLGAQPRNDERPSNEERPWKDRSFQSPKGRAEKKLSPHEAQPREKGLSPDADRRDKNETPPSGQSWGNIPSFSRDLEPGNQTLNDEDRPTENEAYSNGEQSAENRTLDDDFRCSSSPELRQAPEPESSPLSSDPWVELLLMQLC